MRWPAVERDSTLLGSSMLYAYRQAVMEARVPKGPRGEKRPADVIGGAVKVMRIATGEEPNDREDAPVLTPGQQLGKLGGVRHGRGT